MATDGKPADAVRIRDFSDRELLALFIDMGHKVTAREMAQRVFNRKPDDDELPRDTRCVTSRFVWMRRYGLVERAEDGSWQPSRMGLALRTERADAKVTSGIEEMGENKLLDLANTVGVKLVHAHEIPGRAMQRELAHQIARRRARLRGW